MYCYGKQSTSKAQTTALLRTKTTQSEIQIKTERYCMHSVTSVKRRAKGLTKYVRYKDVSFILKFFSQVFYLYRGLPYIEGR